MMKDVIMHKTSDTIGRMGGWTGYLGSWAMVM
jgi:hypothetical protein